MSGSVVLWVSVLGAKHHNAEAPYPKPHTRIYVVGLNVLGFQSFKAELSDNGGKNEVGRPAKGSQALNGRWPKTLP